MGYSGRVGLQKLPQGGSDNTNREVFLSLLHLGMAEARSPKRVRQSQYGFISLGSRGKLFFFYPSHVHYSARKGLIFFIF